MYNLLDVTYCPQSKPSCRRRQIVGARFCFHSIMWGVPAFLFMRNAEYSEIGLPYAIAINEFGRVEARESIILFVLLCLHPLYHLLLREWMHTISSAKLKARLNVFTSVFFIFVLLAKPIPSERPMYHAITRKLHIVDGVKLGAVYLYETESPG